MSEVLGPESRPEGRQSIPEGANSIGNGKSLVLLRIRNFRFLWGGTILSNAASWIQQIALNWLVYNLTGSGTMLATINMIWAASSLVMIPFAGVLIDCVNHRNLLLVKNLWLFAIALGLGLILLFGRSHIYYLFIFAFLGGLTQTLDQTLEQVAIFDLVPRAETLNAEALIQTGWAVTRSFGPAIGGFLILWLGPGGNFLVQAGAYALIAITIMQLQFPAQEFCVVWGSPLQNMRKGIQYIMKERVTRTFMLIGFILPLFTIPIFTILPTIYAVKVFHGGANVLGILLGSIGVGGIFGSVATASLARLERQGLVQLVSLFLLSLSIMAFAFSTKLWVAIPLLSLGGFFEAIFLTTNQTLLQLSIPQGIRGRVTSVLSLAAGLSLLGSLMAGAGSDLLGGPKMITLVLAGIAACMAMFVLFASSTVRNYRLSQGITSNATTTPL